MSVQLYLKYERVSGKLYRPAEKKLTKLVLSFEDDNFVNDTLVKEK